jgi:hypothetical protein
MSTLTLGPLATEYTLGGWCLMHAVTAYSSAAQSTLQSAPVTAAAALGDNTTAVVAAGRRLFTVTITGVVTELLELIAEDTFAPYHPVAALAFSHACSRVTCTCQQLLLAAQASSCPVTVRWHSLC